MVQMSLADQAVVKALPGNDKCADCGMKNPQWASVSFGTTFCLECSGIHRSLGVHISFVRSIAMDSWTDQHLSLMRAGGNAACAKYLKEHGISPSTPIKQKYPSPQAQLYKAILKARVNGLPEPTSLPTPAPLSNSSNCSSSSNRGDSMGMERLKGESEQAYVARQYRLREEAKTRMRSKFGNRGMSGGGGKMAGIGSDSSYDPNRGYSDSAFGDINVDGLVSGFSSVMSSVGDWGQTGMNKASQLVNDPDLKDNVRSTSTVLYNTGLNTGSSLWTSFSTTASKIASNLSQPDDDDGLLDFQRKMHEERENRLAGTTATSGGNSRYSGFGSEDLINGKTSRIGATKVTQSSQESGKDLIDFNSWGNEDEFSFAKKQEPQSAPTSSHSNSDFFPSLTTSAKDDSTIQRRETSSKATKKKIEGTGDDFFSSFGA